MSDIASERAIAAPPELVHALLADIAAWRLWSPHIAASRPSAGRVATGDRVDVRAWFSPRPVPMVLDAADAPHGLRWHSSALGHTLRYANAVEPDGSGGSRVRFSAAIEGPLAAPLTFLARPLSALGQRRRLARLDRLAGFVLSRGS